jgi:hypothetical protein
MGITFSKKENRQRIVEPIFSKTRQKYRGSRFSVLENNEINSLIVDLERITIQLQDIDNLIDQESTKIIGFPTEDTLEQKLEDGAKQVISEVEVFYDEDSSELEELVISSLATLSAKLARIEHKVKIMEDRA